MAVNKYDRLERYHSDEFQSGKGHDDEVVQDAKRCALQRLNARVATREIRVAERIRAQRQPSDWSLQDEACGVADATGRTRTVGRLD